MKIGDEFIVLPILLGVGYAIFVRTAGDWLLGDLWPRVFGPRARPLAIATFSFGVGLAFAGAKYGELDDPAAKFYTICGWSLMLLAAWLWLRRNEG